MLERRREIPAPTFTRHIASPQRAKSVQQAAERPSTRARQASLCSKREKREKRWLFVSARGAAGRAFGPSLPVCFYRVFASPPLGRLGFE